MVAQLGPITIMPSGRVQAIQSYLDNYDETAPLLALEFDKRNTTAVLAGASLRASVNAGAMTVFAEVGYEDYLSYDADRITAKLVNNTAQATSLDITDPQAPGISFKVGLNGQITQNIHLDAQYGLALQDGNGQVHSGKIRVKAPF